MSETLPRLYYERRWMLVVPALVGLAAWKLSEGRGALREVALTCAMLGGMAYLQWGLNRLYAAWHPKPRELDGIHDLEKAYVAWRSELGPDARKTFASGLLFSAYRCAPLRPIRRLIARPILSITDSGELTPAENGRIESEIRGCLKAHAARERRPRAVPLRDHGLGHLEPARVAAVSFGVGSWLFWISGTAIPRPDILQSVPVRLVASFSIVYLFVWGIGMAWSVRAQYRRQLRFRVLFVGLDEQPGEHVFQLLDSLFSLGEVIAALGDQGSAVRAQALGVRPFVIKDAELPTVLDAFSDHTDLVIVDGRRPDIVGMVRERVSLPQGRCWVVLPEGVDAPPGFARLSAKRCGEAALQLRLQEASGPDHTTVLGLASPYATWRLGYVLGGMLMFLGLGLLPYQSSRWFGCFYVACGFAVTFPRYLGERRRRAMDEHRLRAVRAPRISHFLSDYTRLDGYAVVASSGLAIFAHKSVLEALSGGNALELRVIPLSLSLVVSLFCARAYLAPGLARALKWMLDWNFRILILRRNAPQVSARHKALVMPLLGAYGQVLLIQDEHLRAVNIRGQAAGTHEALAESAYTLSVDDDIDHWQALILREISLVDFVVFDWTGEVTANMEWEFIAASRQLPGERILVLCTPLNRGAIEALVQNTERLLETVIGPELLSLPSDTATASSQLRATLLRIMSRLTVTPRLADRREQAHSAVPD